MIYITGDCHADFTRFNTENFPEQEEMTKNDYVIICGDFGGVWNKDEESSSFRCLKSQWSENAYIIFSKVLVDLVVECFRLILPLK